MPISKDRDAAIQMAKLIIAAGRKVPSRPRAQELSNTGIKTVETNDRENQRGKGGIKLAHDAAMRLKDHDKKFSVDFGEY